MDMTKTTTPTVDRSPYEEEGCRLILAHVAGDNEAFRGFMSLFRVQIYSYLMRCGLDSATCDDLFQDVVLAIHNNSHRYNPAYPVSPWIFTILANKVRTHLRQNPVPYNLTFNQENSDSLEQDFEARETAKFLSSQLAKLPEEQRQALVLACVEGLSYEDVGKVLGVTVTGVKTLVRRARLQLESALNRKKLTERREVGA